MIDFFNHILDPFFDELTSGRLGDANHPLRKFYKLESYDGKTYARFVPRGTAIVPANWYKNYWREQWRRNHMPVFVSSWHAEAWRVYARFHVEHTRARKKTTSCPRTRRKQKNT